MDPIGHEPSRSGKKALPVLPVPCPFPSFYTAGERTFTDAVEHYVITGGTPEYVKYFHPGCDLMDIVRQEILQPNGALYNHPIRLLSDCECELELVCPLLHAISLGHHRADRLAYALKVPKDRLLCLLRTLKGYGIIQEKAPIASDLPHDEDRNLYFMIHPFFEFWFRFSYPCLDRLDANDSETALESIRKHFNRRFIPLSYRRICEDIFISLCDSKQIHFSPDEIGPYWTTDLSSETSINLLSVDHQRKKLFAGDYRYEVEPLDSMVFFALEQNVNFAGVLRNTFPGYDIIYGLFSKSGFTKRIQNISKSRDDVILIQEDHIQIYSP